MGFRTLDPEVKSVNTFGNKVESLNKRLSLSYFLLDPSRQAKDELINAVRDVKVHFTEKKSV